MSTGAKIVLFILGLIVAAFGIAFLTSSYLVSKLDGRGPTSTPQTGSGLERYASEEGVEFAYPRTYRLSAHTEGNAERQWEVLVLLPQDYAPPQGGEGAPSISLGVYPNPEELTLEQWVKADSRSNFKLSADQTLESMTLRGVDAVRYTHDGLYPSDAVAAAHKGKIFVFTGQWMDSRDQIRDDFQNLLKTIQFN